MWASVLLIIVSRQLHPDQRPDTLHRSQLSCVEGNPFSQRLSCCLSHSVLLSALHPHRRCETVVMGSRGLGITKRALLNLLAVGSGGSTHYQAAGLGSCKDPARCPACPLCAQAGSLKPGCKELASWWLSWLPRRRWPRILSTCADASQARQGQTMGCPALYMPQFRITSCTTPSATWVSASPGATPAPP